MYKIRYINIFLPSLTKINLFRSWKHTCTRIPDTNKSKNFNNNHTLLKNYRDMRIRIRESIKNKTHHKNIDVDKLDKLIDRSLENHKRSIYG